MASIQKAEVDPRASEDEQGVLENRNLHDR